MTEHISPIPSRLYNAAVGGHVAGADQIIDDNTGLTLDKVAGGTLEEKKYTSNSNNGMGRVVLRKNLVEGVNTLTQNMVNQANTIYVIQYDFTLGENITIPDNCVLEFDGGSISDATGIKTFAFNNTILSGNPKIDTKCSGQLKNIDLYARWFNILPSPYGKYIDVSDAIDNIKTIIVGRHLYFEAGIYYVSRTIMLDDGYYTIKGVDADFEVTESSWRDRATTFMPLDNFTDDYIIHIRADYWGGATRSVNLSDFDISCKNICGGLQLNMYDASSIRNINITGVCKSKTGLKVGNSGNHYTDNDSIAQTCLIENVYVIDRSDENSEVEVPLIEIKGFQEGTIINMKGGVLGTGYRKINTLFELCTGSTIIASTFSGGDYRLALKSCTSLSFHNCTYEGGIKLLFDASILYTWIGDKVINSPKNNDVLVQYDDDNNETFSGKVYASTSIGINFAECTGTFDLSKQLYNKTKEETVGILSSYEYYNNSVIRHISPRVLASKSVYKSVIDKTIDSEIEILGDFEPLNSANNPIVNIKENVEHSKIIIHNINDSTNNSPSDIISGRFKSYINPNWDNIPDGYDKITIKTSYLRYFKAKIETTNNRTFHSNGSETIIELKWNNKEGYYNCYLIKGAIIDSSSNTVFKTDKTFVNLENKTEIIAPHVGCDSIINLSNNNLTYTIGNNTDLYVPIGIKWCIIASQITNIYLNVTCNVHFNGAVYNSFKKITVKANSPVYFKRINNTEYVLSGDNIKFDSVHNYGSGTTIDRPTTVVVGEKYFDTTLGKPIYWNGTAWVDATGTSV